MKQKNFHSSRKLVKDITTWTILIFSLFILSSSNVFGQCSCDDELVPTVSLGASEGFESYTVNQPIPIGGRWSLYPASGGYNPVQATVVSTPVNCGNRSLRFQYNGSNPVDMIYMIDPKRTSFKMYIPSGKGGTFALLMGNGETQVLELQFGTGGTCTVNNGDSFSYPQATWFRISIIRIDNSFKVFRDYDHVSTFGTITEVFYANFDANDTNEQFYIDKLCTYFYNNAVVNCTQEFNPQCLNLSNDAAGINSCEARNPGYIDAEFTACESSGGSPCAGATPIYCGETLNGTTIGENFKFYRPDYGSCLGNNSSNDYRAPDKVYTFFHTGGDAQIHLWSTTANVDFDIFLLSNCEGAWSGNPQIVIENIPPNAINPNITCIERGISYVDQASGFDSEYIFVKDLAAGTYYIVVDGQHWQNAGQIDDVGSFQLSLHCEDLVCNNATVIKCGDKLLNESNSNGANNVSIYCGPFRNTAGSTASLPPGAGCTGNERVYKFTPNVNGNVTINVTGIGSNEDFDAFVFLDCDHTNCLVTGTNGSGQAEILTFEGEKGREYIIVVDGYRGTSGNYDIEIVCPPVGYCDVCLQCFKHRPKFNASNAIEFFSGWCDGQNPTRMLAFTNTWTVEGTSVQFIDNTNNTSINPIIVFPGTGRYRVCQKIYSGTTLLYECCQWVNINPCSGIPKAHFTSVYNSSDATFTLNATQSQNADNIEWQYSESGITYITGNNTSSISKISIPNGKCTNVCIYVYNGCGVSTYCMTLCSNNTNCTGTTPPVLFASLPDIDPEGRKITYTAPLIANATYSWDFGDGSPTVNSRAINYTYSKDGNFIVCLKVVIGCRIYCYCWCMRPRLCPPQFDPPAGMIKYAFTGTEADPKYTITSQNFTVAPNESWLLDNQPINNSSGKSTLEISLPQNIDFVICIPYLKTNGCLAYKCITLRGGNPFSCTSIGWKFVQNSGYQFNLSALFSDISWTLDETGQSLGTTATSNFVLPVNPCGWRTISVRYFDGTRYWICCLRIYLCAPDDCFGNIYYGFSNDNGQFRLEESGATNISWYFDDAPNTTLGTSSSISVPYPVNCTTRWISVKYRDASGRWRICCRLVYFCNPFNCDLIKINYVEGSGYKFSLDQTYQNMSWIIDETSQSLGSGVESIFYPLPTTCAYRTVTVRFFVPGIGWRMCCYRFWWCNPALCSDRINITQSGANYTLSTTSNFQNITWFRESTQLGSGNNITASLPAGTYKIYIRYYNPSDKCWYWCCRSFTPGGGSSTPPWTNPPTTIFKHTIAFFSTLESNINGTPLQTGDWIGVFYNDNGTLKPAGFKKWESQNLLIDVSGDDPTTNAVKEGFSADEVFSLKVWKSFASQEFNVSATYFPVGTLVGATLTDATNKFKDRALSAVRKLEASTKTTINIPLNTGWNLISSNVVPDNPDMEAVFSQILSQIEVVRDLSGSFIPNFFNGIGNWNIQKGYYVKAKSPVTLSITGNRVGNNNSLIPITSGWQMIAYYCDNNIPVGNAFSLLLNDIETVRTLSNSYIPGFSSPDAICMKPFQGFLVKGKPNVNKSLAYTCIGSCQNISDPDNNNVKFRNKEINPLSDNSAMLVMSKDVINKSLSHGDVIKVLSESGIICGESEWLGENIIINIWGDDDTTPEKEGLAKGEKFLVMVYSAIDNTEKNIHLVLNPSSKEYQPNAIFWVTGTESSDQNYIKLRPVPADNFIHIEISTAENEDRVLEIREINGQLLRKIDLRNDTDSTNSFSLDITDLPSGVYYVCILGSKTIKSARFIVAK